MPISYLNRVNKDVLSSLERTKPLKPDKSRRPLIILVSLMTIAAIYGIGFGHHYFFILHGKITTSDNSQGSRLIEIQGYNRNILPELKYLWVAAGIPSLNLCWPKRQIYCRNTQFQTKFIENGPIPTVKVSLYALNQNHHLEIGKWREEIQRLRQEEEFPLLPEG